MNDRLQFATLLFACHIGIMGRQELIAAADARIVEVENPEDWLIELSTQGDCSALNRLAQREFKHVSFEVLRMAYQAWSENKMNTARFHQCCTELLLEGATLCQDLSWYHDLSGVDDEFDLAENGGLGSREARRNIRVTLEQIFQRLPRHWAESSELVELVTLTSPIYRNDFTMLFLDYPVPKRDEFREWWQRRGPAVIERPDGRRTKAVVEFQVWLLQLKGIHEPTNFKPGDGLGLGAMLPDVTSAEAPIGSKLLVTPELWNLILA
jgi:hypothetical protein